MKYRMKRHAVVQPLEKPYRFIPLTRNQNAIVDAKDFEWLSQWNWYAHWCPDTRSFYAERYLNKSKKVVRMHKIILSCNANQEGDHKNHDTLDNRIENLRRCTHQQNSRNHRLSKNSKSIYKGTRLRHGTKRWGARIWFNGRCIALGSHDTEEQAARAYDEAAKKYFGEFAHLNFPLNQQSNE